MKGLSSEQKGRRAQEILEDEDFMEVLDQVRTEVIIQWTLTKPNDPTTRENLYMQNRGLDEVLRGLRTLVSAWTVDKAKRKNTKKGRLSK